jgi:predicted CopG family antitoxin
MVKVVTISDESYEELKKWKGNKSFSETILALTKKRNNKNLLEFIRSMKPNPKLADAIESVYKERRKFKFKKVRF